MKRNLLKLALCAMALATTIVASAQSAARLGRVAYWDLTQDYSQATKNALTADAKWNRTGSGGNYNYRYGITLANEAVYYNETDLFPNLKFTVTDGNRLVFTSSLLQVQKNSGLKIALPELAAGNVVEIKTACGDSKYLTFEGKTASTDYSATIAPTATTSEQTYKFTILEGGSNYVLIPNEANTSKTLDITFIKIYADATKAEAGTETLYNWTFSNVHSSFSDFDTSKHTWSWSSNGFYPSPSSYTDQVLNVPFVKGNTNNGISELNGLKFTTTDNTKIRIDANDSKNGIVLIKNSSTTLGLGKVIVPIAKTGSKVKVTNTKTVKQWNGTDSDTSGTAAASDGYFTADSDPFYFGCYGNNDTRVSAIAVLYNFATVSDNNPSNGSLAFASAGNEVTKNETGEDVTNGFFCGSTVTITATPDDGYYLSALTGTYYEDGENTTEKLEISGTGNTRTFTMPTTGDVTLTATFSKVPVTITDAGYATLYSDKALDFTGTGITAYVAAVEGDNVTFNEVTSAPAETGLLLKGEANTYNIPVTASPASVTSDLVGTLAETTVPTGTFVLFKKDEKVGFYKTTAASFTVGANTAWLPADVSPSREFIGFDDETTGIEELKNSKTEELKSYYNLNGQRVANPTKGLYIVNGKKVIIK